MPILTKPCTGKLSDVTRELLRAGRERAEWGVYPCEVCGQSVAVLAADGDWIAERHWPTVIYAPRKPNVGRYSRKA